MEQAALTPDPRIAEPVDLSEKFKSEMEAVAQLRVEYERSPTPESAMRLRRRTDAVLHLQNLLKGSPRSRARLAAAAARRSVLSKAFA